MAARLRYLVPILTMAVVSCQSNTTTQETSLINIQLEKDASSVKLDLPKEVRIHELFNSTSGTHYGLDISHLQKDWM